MVGMTAKRGRPKKHVDPTAPASPAGGRTGITIHLRIDPTVYAAMEDYRGKQLVPPQKTAVIEASLIAFLIAQGCLPEGYGKPPKA